MDHFLESGQGFGEDACAARGGGLHAGAEHFYGRDDTGGCDAGDGAGEEGGVGVRDDFVDGTAGGCTEGVVAGEVYDVGRDGHDEGGR